MNATARARRGLVSSQRKDHQPDQKQSGSIIKFGKEPDIKQLPADARKALAGKQVFIPTCILSEKKGVIILALTLLEKHLPFKKFESKETIIIPKTAFAVIRHCKQP